MRYTFLRPDPMTAYRTNYLLLPKAVLGQEEIARLRDDVFTLRIPDVRGIGMTIHKLWRESEHHLYVPREYPWVGVDPIPIEQEFPAMVFEDNERAFMDGQQETAWSAFAKADKGVLNLACGRGKSWLACKKIAQRCLPALIVVTNQGSIPEWEREIRQSIYKGHIGRIQGARREWKHPVVIGTIHTLAKHADAWSEDMRRYYGTIVYDETHRLAAPEFKRTASLFWGARYGLSATPKRSDGMEEIYYWHLGGIFHSDLYQELTPQIFFLALPTYFPSLKPFYDKGGEISMPLLWRALGNDEQRNRVLATLIHKCVVAQRHVLVLGHSVDGLYAVQKVAGIGTVITQNTPGARRTQIIQDARVTYATPGLAKDSLNVPTLDTVIFTTPFKEWSILQQGMGRALRKYGTKNNPLIFLLEDLGVGPCVSMCRSLRKELKEHGYEYDVVREP